MTAHTTEPRERLDSWKEIASYLERSVRTVRRWEAREGLPVHRHQHSKGSTVFAFRDELDQWRIGRVAEANLELDPALLVESPVEVELESAVVAPMGQRTLRLVAVMAFLALILSAFAVFRAISPGESVERWDEWVERVPLQQRLLSEALYNRSAGSHQAALLSFEALVGLGPVPAPMVAQAVESCLVVDELATCADFVARAADSSPKSQELQYRAAQALAIWGDDMDRARVYAARAGQSLESGRIDLDAGAYAFIEMFDARADLLNGDVIGSLAAMDELAARSEELKGSRLDAVAQAAGLHCLAMGRAECASSWFERIDAEDQRHELQSMVLFARADMAGLTTHLEQGAGYRQPFSAVLLGMTKQLEAAEVTAARLAQSSGSAGSVLVAQGGLSMMQGDVETASVRLQAGLEGIESPGIGMHFVGLDMMSRIAEGQGDVDGAIDWLEMTSQQRKTALFQGAGLFWIKCQDRLAGLYRANGRIDEAVRLERELLSVLALSDDGDPVSDGIRRRTA